MKNQVKKFSQYIKESDEFGMRGDRAQIWRGARNGIASWEIFDYTAVVRFGDGEIVLDDDDANYDEEGNFSMDKVFAAAAELGASSDMIWSIEDNTLMFKSEK
jgi:hypothetical protein